MNKVITDGLDLMPPAFAQGLDVWSSGNGAPRSETYAGSDTAVLRPADRDFAGPLEIVKTSSVTRLRYTGETSILPGCYLRVSARVKCLAGPPPNVRIAGYPVKAGGDALGGVVTVGPSVPLARCGAVVEVSAIIGTGARNGVDMVWPEANYAHLGLDFTGPNGGVVRVDDLVIEDVSSVFLRNMIGLVDVRDYGAMGDGVTDDSAAFERADRCADGREILVSEGVYFLGGSVTLNSRVRFQGTVTQPDTHHLNFRKNFNYLTYLDAFGEEELAFRKAFQALLQSADHECLDLGGRRVSLSGPMDMQAAAGGKTVCEARRMICNGRFEPIAGPNWDSDVVVAQARYRASEPDRLTDVADIEAIAVGALVTGDGVGREVYVTSVDIAASSVTLSAHLFDAVGTRQFTFTRFKYLLDFSGFTKMSDMILKDVALSCGGACSGILLPPDGAVFQVRDCRIQHPKDRGITSHGTGCRGMTIDRSVFVSDAQSHGTIAFNVNADGSKIRNNRAVHFAHFGVVRGSGTIISNNHVFQDDAQDGGPRLAGLVLTSQTCLSTLVGNYIDNCFIEWTSEHDAPPQATQDTPEATGQSFEGLTITGNLFLASGVCADFAWIVVKPYGAGQSINGLNVQGNVFRTRAARVGRVEKVDTTYADLEYDSMRNIIFAGNAFTGIDHPTRNPHVDTHRQNSPDRTWTVNTGGHLPFAGRARTIDALVPVNAIRNDSGGAVFAQPYASPAAGTRPRGFDIVWPEPVTGEIRYSVRMDNPA